jgi:hypothetical protein
MGHSVSMGLSVESPTQAKTGLEWATSRRSESNRAWADAFF